MSSSKQRPPQTPRPVRNRREPLFPLEADDVVPRRSPPQPLKDIVGDLDDAFAPPLRGSADRARPAPARDRTEPERPAARPAAVPVPAARPVQQQVAERESRRPLRAAPSSAERLIDETETLRRKRAQYDESATDLFHAERLTARPYRASVPMSAPPLAVNPWLLVVIIASLSILVLSSFGGESTTRLSPWGNLMAAITGEAPQQAARITGIARPAGDYTLKAAPSISPQEIDRILQSYGSPASGSGAVWHSLGVQYGIDPAFAVAFFIHESGAGTARNWAGNKPDGTTTHNVGNIICAGYPTCFNRFRDYPSWEIGIADWYRLIDVEYIQGRGHRTVADIIPVYAPSFENDVDGYVNVVHRLVDEWRQGRIP